MDDVHDTVARQKSAPKRKKRVFRVCILPTPPSTTTSIIMPRIPLASILITGLLKRSLIYLKDQSFLELLVLKKNLLLSYNAKSSKYLPL